MTPDYAGRTDGGRHNRLVVMRDVREPHRVTIREDRIGLPETTPTQRHKAARGWMRIHPRGSHLVFVESVEWPDGRSIDHEYFIAAAENPSDGTTCYERLPLHGACYEKGDY